MIDPDLVYDAGEQMPTEERVLAPLQPTHIPIFSAVDPIYCITETAVKIDPCSPYPGFLFDKAEAFAQSRDPLAGIELLLLCREFGLYPPREVLDWIAAGLEDWDNHNGDKSLDQALGIDKPGRHNPVILAIRDRFRESYLEEMCHLRLMFGVSIDKAAEMIASRIDEKERADAESIGLRYSADTFAYHMKHKDWPKRYKVMAAGAFGRYLSNLPRNKKLQELKRYPRKTWPDIK